MQKSDNHLVIMAGGIGSRFWPMSTQERPKQFVDVLGTGRTLIQLTLDRFRGILPIENVWVVTSAAYAAIVHEQLPEVPECNILQEPCRRNTAPCVAYVSWRIKATNPHANIVVSPSDHVVLDTEEFRRVIISSLKFANETDAIITLGMKPTRPETGYGYIQADLSTASVRNRELYRVDRFREKPDVGTAREYIKQNNFFWNAGIFVWNVNTIISAFRIYAPGISNIFERLLPYYGKSKEQALINEWYPQCESISVDYAIMEHAEEIFCFPASFGWSDLGTWGSLRENSERDQAGNALIGPRVEVYGCRNCIVHATDEHRVVVEGLDGYIVAEKDDVLLICPLEHEQDIKKYSEER
ncbi:MAG: mannose-1-phosphate guanylyltransferase [Bacteroidaceae bacterium]|nr:mannose-1-phosphate guanylyltransferase [Bacteroidaceae bacterium]